MSDVLLAHLLGGRPVLLPSDDVRAFWSAWQAQLERWSSTAERAAAGGFAADRLGYAFATGYQAALCALCPELPPKHMTGLCATEEGGNHPRAIQSRLEPNGDGFFLSGEKRWATLAPLARELLVVASSGGDEQGRNRLRVVRVETDAPGVAIEPLADTPFVPEIPHAVVRFERVKISPERVLPGDGYDRYLKPFRTVEDIHVHLAGLGYLIGVGRRASFAEALLERAAALVVTGRALAALDPLAAETHVALAGVIAESRRLFEDCEPAWSKVAEDERLRWQRDRVLYTVAERARSARQKSAWDRLKSR